MDDVRHSKEGVAGRRRRQRLGRAAHALGAAGWTVDAALGSFQKAAAASEGVASGLRSRATGGVGEERAVFYRLAKRTALRRAVGQTQAMRVRRIRREDIARRVPAPNHSPSVSLKFV